VKYVILSKCSLILALLGCACATRSAECPQKNVLFIISDDCNDLLGCWGHPEVKTPHIDALSEKGVRFQRAYSQFSVCNPSRASFLTGLRPGRTRVFNNKVDFREEVPDILTMPQYFKENGCWTGTIGKVFHEGERDSQSWSWCADWRVDEQHGTTGSGRNVSGGELPWTQWRAVESGTLSDDRIADLAVEKIHELSDGRPFFLGVGFLRPHDPFFAPKRFFDLYPLESIKLPENMDASGIPPGAYGVEVWRKAYEKMDDADKKELIRAYYACISYMDEQVGKVLSALKESGLEKDTLIVFLGDHGYHNWEKNWWGKCTVWEQSARTPLIIVGDTLPHRDEDCFRISEFIDICPTLVELCGLPAMPDRDGRSLVPLLENPEMDARKWNGMAFTQLGALRSVRTERWRYCEERRPNGWRALYDHNVDPEESTNLILQPERGKIVRHLEELMKERFR